MSTTIVTSLFNIHREKMDGRTWNEYINWFSKTISLNSPMVIFIDSELESFVWKYRDSNNTKVIIQSLSDVAMYNHIDRMNEIIHSSEYRQSIKDPCRIECNYAEYSIIQFSKFEWMHEAAKHNYFDTDYFIWMDAGLSRFFTTVDVRTKYPSDRADYVLSGNNNKVLIQVFKMSYPDLFSATELGDEYLKDNRSFVMGGMFGGGKSAIDDIYKEVIDVFETKMLPNNIVNNEQIVVGYLFKNKPNLFNVFVNDSRIHRTYELINRIS